MHAVVLLTDRYHVWIGYFLGLFSLKYVSRLEYHLPHPVSIEDIIVTQGVLIISESNRTVCPAIGMYWQTTFRFWFGVRSHKRLLSLNFYIAFS